MTVLFVALAGGLGAVTRCVVDGEVERRLRWRRGRGSQSAPRALPLGTLLINVTGSLLLGLLVGLATRHPGVLPPTVVAAVGTGFCGGYTTFSTASVECVRLWLAGGPASAAGYAGLTLVGSVAAALLGMSLLTP
ncbi:CrcB protein [Kineosphaera limosa]|uniref:Fluoride-specific ion channel FluC n=1 Tax=Kineosphaera limosa NBRC 100340 TaxID=1184609 RepID=K6WPJ0_9MICO|nr:CrcB family protein [Kineosphaera limosa]NYE00085.1 CrcB protein [Kineosphaera limosa]GAB95741.1 protein CrcB homolog [Kineosphaera limosa NBRC 100340]